MARHVGANRAISQVLQVLDTHLSRQFPLADTLFQFSRLYFSRRQLLLKNLDLLVILSQFCILLLDLLLQLDLLVFELGTKPLGRHLRRDDLFDLILHLLLVPIDDALKCLDLSL